jgi:hypothetical protein
MKLKATLAFVAIMASLPARAQHAGHGAMPERPPSPRSTAPAPTFPTGPRVVEVRVTEAGFIPSEVRAGAGESISLRITRETEATCAKEMNVFGRGVQVALPRGQEVKVTIDVDSPGEVRVGCLGDRSVRLLIMVAPGGQEG